ncbi:MAG TPA: hypothetical protein VLA34_05685, partial [Candidatus Krumholzibacterium sp.]|nr:hypothetical protein [Candidatus Krumholzibacterium sp.]
MEYLVAGVLEKICSVCGAARAELAIFMESGKERLPVFATSYRRGPRRKTEDHRQLSLFPGQGCPDDADRDITEISNEAAGESFSSEAAREMVYSLRCDWTLQKAGPRTW